MSISLLKKYIISLLVLLVLIGAVGCSKKETIEETEEESVIEVVEEDYDAEKNKIDVDAYEGTILLKSKDAGRDYIDSTLFLGDSNTVRFQGYEDKDGERFTSISNSIGVVGMGVGAIPSLKCVELEGRGRVTMVDAVKALQPERVIIFFGTNNLSGTSTDATAFIKTYGDSLKAIKSAYPSVDLIVGSIFPVAEARDYRNVSMTQIDAYNKAILELCEKEDYKFLNVSEALKDEKTGYAKKGYCISDGLHLSKEGITALFEYIRTHSYITEDDRPKPLAAIPKVIGVPSGLISDNPLATSSNRIPVEFTCSAGGYLSGATSQMVGSGSASGAVTAIPNAGYHFAYWTSSTGEYFNSPTLSYTVYKADANGIILTAYFAADEVQEVTQEEEKKEEPKIETYTVTFYDCNNKPITSETITAGASPVYSTTGAGKDISWLNDGKGNYYQQGCTPEKEEEKEPAHVHSYSWMETRAATCEMEGVETYICSCNDIADVRYISALGHSFATSVGDDSCTVITVCSRCGAESRDSSGCTPIDPPVDPPTEPISDEPVETIEG